MKITSLTKSSCPLFVRVSNTEGQIRHYNNETETYVPTHWVDGTKSELDELEELYKRMLAIHSLDDSKFVTVSSAFAIADTVMVESPPNSEIRPVAKTRLPRRINVIRRAC